MPGSLNIRISTRDSLGGAGSTVEDIKSDIGGGMAVEYERSD